MARSISQIQQIMLDAIAADEVLAPVATSTSKVAIFRLFTRIVASCIWTIEVLFDTLKQELNDLLATLKPHTLRWYARKAEAFQYGSSLPIDSDVYDNSLLTEDQINDSLIIKYVAVTESLVNGKIVLRIKVATESDDLEPLTTPQLDAFTEYISRVKDAGVRVLIESNVADQLKMKIRIYYDPLILNSNGQRIDGSDLTPVQTAVDTYLKNLPFNGTFVLAYLTDALQKVDGVVIPHIVEASAKYGALAFTSIDVKYEPDAGYLRFVDDSDLTLEFVPQSQLQ
jgi:hypothetical protein